MDDSKRKSSDHKHIKEDLPHHFRAHRGTDDEIDLKPRTLPPKDLQYAKTIMHVLSLAGSLLSSFLWFVVFMVVIIVTVFVLFENRYQGKIYPHVTIDSIAFGGQSESEAQAYWSKRNFAYINKLYTFSYKDEAVATISGKELAIGFDAELSARQAYLIGRSGNIVSDFMSKYFKLGNKVSAMFRWDEEAFDELISPLADTLAIPVAEALFEFSDGKVTQFKPSRDGRMLDTYATKQEFTQILKKVPESVDPVVNVPLIVKIIKPQVTTESANDFGIKELIGRGYSEYQGSIPGRMHNVALAASKLHGILIKPGAVFSFNEALGDVSAATGFQPAYIIKGGRTVLGDGGGVCQVSSTFFRAALNAGLPIVERYAHAYRVHYYEEAGYKAGLDATVFAPSVDLKVNNDTPGYILIQVKIDESVPSLTFEFYGTNDGRKAEILDHKVWGITPPPPALYQDDPTLPVGVVKQVDFSAWGAKASFQYKVTSADGQILQDEMFYSNFRPWQAVFLKGTKTQ